MSEPTLDLLELELSVADVREGDRFVSDGRHYWTALEDARRYELEGEPLVTVRILHADGGDDVRAWDADATLTIERLVTV